MAQMTNAVVIVVRTASFPGELSLISRCVVQKLHVSGPSQPSHMHTQTHAEYKAFCQQENRVERRGGSEQGRGKKKLKSKANWTACFLRAPLTAQCG